MNDELHAELPCASDALDASDASDALELTESVAPSEETTPPETDAVDPILAEVTALRAEMSELRRELDLRRRADEVNRRNASRSAGHVGTNVAPEYYTPDEVRAMSPSEVRENYEKIRTSMKKW